MEQLYRYIIIIFFTILTINILVLLIQLWVNKSNKLNSSLKTILLNIFVESNNVMLKVMITLLIPIILKALHPLLTNIIHRIRESSYLIYNNNIELFNIVIGAFLASTFGIVTHRYLQRCKIKDEVKINSTMLYNDLRNILSEINNMNELIKALKFSDTQNIQNIWSLNLINHLNFDHNWRRNYSYLTRNLSIEHYYLISKIYASVEQINSGLDNNNVLEIATALKKAIYLSNLNVYSGYVGTTSEMVLEDLRRLSINKSIKKFRFNLLIEELIFLAKKKKLYDDVELEAIDILSSVSLKEANILIPEIINRLNASNNLGFKKMKNFKERLIYDVLLTSESIKCTFGVCSLKLENEGKK